MTSPINHSISPELACLFELASRASDNERKSGVTYINDMEIREERLFEMAGRHGVMSMLLRYRDTKDELLAKVPTLNVQSNLSRTGELIRILGRFNEESLRVIPYKGPTLADLAYGDLGLREFGDLDLLIERESFQIAHCVMLEDGYEPEIELEAGQWRSFMATTNVLAYWHPGKEISVELHWELSPGYLPFPIDFTTLYGRREPSYPGGREVMTMSGEDLLLYLCLHGAKHGWERLSWIIDVGGVISRHADLDWERIISDVRGSGCDRTFGLGLALAREVTKAKLPPLVEEMIQMDVAIPDLMKKVVEWLGASEAPSLLEQTIFLLQLQKSPAERGRMLYRIAMTPSVADWRALRLPAPLTGLYRLIRPLRLLIKVKSRK